MISRFPSNAKFDCRFSSIISKRLNFRDVVKNIWYEHFCKVFRKFTKERNFPMLQEKKTNTECFVNVRVESQNLWSKII